MSVRPRHPNLRIVRSQLTIFSTVELELASRMFRVFQTLRFARSFPSQQRLPRHQPPATAMTDRCRCPNHSTSSRRSQIVQQAGPAARVENGRKYSRSVFYFCPSVSVFVGSRFRITEVEMRFLRPFPRNPVCTWN